MNNGSHQQKDKQHIKVFARIRPFNENERNNNATRYMQINGKEIIVPQTHGSKKFTFDKVFDMQSKQLNIYQEAISPIIQEVLKGYNCTVFAYGQTGSGKTHTMIGPELPEDLMTFNSDSDVGIIPRAMGHIFDCLTKKKELDYTIRVSYLEIYNEILNDLLSDEEKNLRIYEDPKNKSSVQVHGLEEVTVYSKGDVYELLRIGSDKRKMAATYMNQQSSRSHSVFTITVHMKETTPEGEELVKTGKLNLVDLAGSENIQRSGATDQRAREAGSINQSLLTLGRVFKALIDKAGHVPYREAKLTRILQDSLGGKTKTTIIATTSPAISNIEETLSTLDYAYKARNILTKPEVNQRYCKTTLIKGYLEEIDKLKKDLLCARKGEGFYLNTDSYETLIRENIMNKEEYLKAVKECAEFENRTGALQRQCTELEEVYSVAQQDLSTAKNTLQRSKIHLKKLCRDRNIKQELINKYSDTEEQFFKTSKEIAIAFDNHIKDHNMLRNKVDKLYENMQENESAADIFENEQTRITSSLEDYYDQFHEDLIRRLQDSKVSTTEYTQQQNDSISSAEEATLQMTKYFVNCLANFAKHIKEGHEQRLRCLEEESKLSKETMNLFRDHLRSEQLQVSKGLDDICSFINSTTVSYQEIFKSFKKTTDDLKTHVLESSDTTIMVVRQMQASINEDLVKLAEEIRQVKQPFDNGAKTRLALQEALDAFDAYVKSNLDCNTKQNAMISKIADKSEVLNKNNDLNWKQHESIMKQNVVDADRQVNNINDTVSKGIDLFNNAMVDLPLRVKVVQDEATQKCDGGLQLVEIKSKEINNSSEVNMQAAGKFTVVINENLKTNNEETLKLKAEFDNSITNCRQRLSDYNKICSDHIASSIDCVKRGIETCSSFQAEYVGIAKNFVSNLNVTKPSGETPSYKNKVTYNIPRKISKRVLQYKDLDVSSISILDESFTESCGRPSLDFYDQSDSEIEYEGQFVTTKAQKTSSAKNSFSDCDKENNDGNMEPQDNT